MLAPGRPKYHIRAVAKLGKGLFMQLNLSKDVVFDSGPVHSKSKSLIVIIRPQSCHWALPASAFSSGVGWNHLQGSYPKDVALATKTEVINNL